MPVRGRAAEPGMAFAVKGYVAEAEVPADAAVIGKRP